MKGDDENFAVLASECPLALGAIELLLSYGHRGWGVIGLTMKYIFIRPWQR